MQLGICVSNEDIRIKIETLNPYVDYFETFTLSDQLIETIHDYTHQIKIVHLPDLNKNCIESLKQASKLDIEKAIVHFFTVTPMKHEQKIATLETLSKIAQERNIQLYLENTEENPSEILAIINEIPDLLFCLDIGHGNLFLNKPSDFVEVLHEFLGHVHIHDNFGGVGEEFDRHLVPEEGDIDFGAVLRSLDAIGYDDSFTLELTPFDSLERKTQALHKTKDIITQHLS